MAVRNLAIERNAVDTFIKQYKKKPESPMEWAQVYKMSYPGGELPQELSTTTAASAYQTMLQKPKIQAAPNLAPTVGQPAGALPGVNPPGGRPSLEQLYGGVQQTQQQAQQFQQPNEAMRILQEAIKTKIGTQQAQIGESELFQKAGLTGMPTLSQSLTQRGAELGATRQEFSNIIGQMAGNYQDMAKSAMFNYEQAVDAYNRESDRLSKIEASALEHKRALEILREKDRLDREMAQLKFGQEKELRGVPTFGQEMELYGAGLERTPGGQITQRVDVSGATAEDIANAIKQHESGGNYKARGASGENGAYQFMPSTWKAWSQAFLNDLPEFYYPQKDKLKKQGLPMTPEWQDRVAQWKVQDWMNKGYSPEQIAAAWNAGEGSVAGDAWRNMVGVNSKGVKYNVPGYVQSVTGILKGQMGKKSTQVAEPSSDLYTQFESVSIGLPSDATRKSAKATFDKYIKAGDTAKAERYLDSMARQSLKGKQNDSFTQMNNMIGEVNNAMSKFDSFASSKPGVYTSVIQSGKSLAGASKNKDWQSFVADISNTQAQYRNQLFGASLTDSELAEANRFLIDFNFDTAQNAKIKLQSLQGLAQRVQRRLLNEERGIFEEATAFNQGQSGSSTSVTTPDGQTFNFPSAEAANNFKRAIGL